MGLLDSVSRLLGGEQAEQDPKTRLLQAALGLLSNDSQAGGIQGVLERFRQAGLGDAVASWIGTGPNQPVSADQVQQALGEQHLERLSTASGLPPQEIAGHLSELLPELINKLTPNGEVPQGGLGQAEALLAQFLGRH